MNGCLQLVFGSAICLIGAVGCAGPSSLPTDRWEQIEISINGKTLSFKIPGNLSKAYPQRINNGARYHFFDEKDWQAVVNATWEFGRNPFKHTKGSLKLVVGVGLLTAPLVIATDDLEGLRELDEAVWNTRTESIRRRNESSRSRQNPGIPEPLKNQHEPAWINETGYLLRKNIVGQELITIVDPTHYLVISVETGISEVGDWQEQASQIAAQIINSIQFR